MRSFIVLCVVGMCWSASITWTGRSGNDNLWDSPANWSPETVPTTNDDVVFPSGSCTIRAQVACHSITLRSSSVLNILPAEVSIGTGGVQMSGTSLLKFQGGGNYQFNVAGESWINSTFNFQSGNLAGTWGIGETGKMELTTAAEKSFQGTKLISMGTFNLNEGQVALGSSATLQLAGTVALVAPTQIRSTDAPSKMDATSAKTTISTAASATETLPQVLFNAMTLFNGVTIGAGLEIVYYQPGSLHAATLAAGSLITTIAEGHPHIGGISGGGTVQAGASLTFDGTVSLAQLDISQAAEVTFSSPAQYNIITDVNIKDGGIQMTSGLTITALTLKGNSRLHGGRVKVSTVDAQASVLEITSHVEVAKSLTIHGTPTTWNLGNGANVDMSNTSTISITSNCVMTSIAGVDPDLPPKIIAAGSVNMAVGDANSWRLTEVNVEGQGAFAFESGACSFTNVLWSCDSITLTEGATFGGSRGNLAWKSFKSEGGQTMNMQLDNYHYSCGSTCPPVTSSDKGLDFMVTVNTARKPININ